MGTLGTAGDFIDGRFVVAERPNGEIKDFSPADLNDHIMTFSYQWDHTDLACEAARKAYLPWARLSREERSRFLLRLRDVFLKDQVLLREAISRDTGKPLWEAQIEVEALIAKIQITLGFSAQLVEEERVRNIFEGEGGLGLESQSGSQGGIRDGGQSSGENEKVGGGGEGFIRYKPRGVMAVLGPFNLPIHMPNGHIIPSLYMGNTIVFKPSEHTPLVGYIYSKCFEKAEFPPGVFNMVQGGGEIGRRLALSDQVDGVLFTGSYEVGMKIKLETQAHYWKILALEMGGKNTTVVWRDADLDKAIYESLVGAYLTAGQSCASTSRILVHPSIKDAFIDRFYRSSKKLVIGHWSSPATFMGPLISEKAVEKYLRFQEIARREGCENLMRGKVLDISGYKGYYVTPSIHLIPRFDPESVYNRTEVFGPSVGIYVTEDMDEVLQNVNASGYGLVLSLFTQDRFLYERALLEARVGVLNWNRTTNRFSHKLPFGGMGKSGNDRPSAHFALRYCSIPVACMEDQGPYLSEKNFPGLGLEA